MAKYVVIFSMLFITLLIIIHLSDACGFGVGCSPGTCGCGGPCGRRKRSMIAQNLRTEFSSICPQTEWKNIIDENLGPNVLSSKYSIQTSMTKKFEDINFFVSCIENRRNYTALFDEHTNDSVQLQQQKQTLIDKYPTMLDIPPLRLKFVSNGEAYCSSGNDKVWCTVIAVLS